MMDLIGIGGYLGGALALLAAVFGYGVAKLRKGRKQGANKVRRDAAVSANKRKDVRDEIDDDIRTVDASSELRNDWTRD